MNKLTAILMAAAVMVLGLTNGASANPACFDETVDLELA